MGLQAGCRSGGALDPGRAGAQLETQDPVNKLEAQPMTEPHVTFYFAYNSPYAFLANTRIEAALAPYDVALVRKPVYSPRPGGQQPDFSNPRMS